MNPDNPTKCSELMADGIHCFMKTMEAYYDLNVENEDVKKVKCPFIK